LPQVLLEDIYLQPAQETTGQEFGATNLLDRKTGRINNGSRSIITFLCGPLLFFSFFDSYKNPYLHLAHEEPLVIELAVFIYTISIMSWKSYRSLMASFSVLRSVRLVFYPFFFLP
jgi:hypothetical protein